MRIVRVLESMACTDMRAPAPVFARMAIVVAALVLVAGCSSDGATDEGDGPPSIVVTTTIWADVVDALTCNGLAEVTTLIPSGSDPHRSEPSPEDRELVDRADLVVANGLNLEGALLDMLDAVRDDGTPVIEIGDLVDPLIDDEGADPHVWFDAQRVISALPELAEAIIDETGIDATEAEECLNGYLAELAGVDAQVVEILDTVPPARRQLVTTHDAFSYFADRHGFEILGTVTAEGVEGANPASLAELGDLIDEAEVPVVFAEPDLTNDELQGLARQSDELEVVALNTGSLGPEGEPDSSYFGFLVTTASTIAEALTAG